MKVFNNKQDTSKQASGRRLAVLNKSTRYAFYGVVFAFPWESLNIGLGENFSLAKVMGLFFFGAALLQPKICFRFPPKEFWLFLLYLAFYALLALGGDAAYDRSTVIGGFSIFQMLVLFWLSYNVMRDERVVKGFLITFIVACLSLAIGGVFMEGVSGGVRSGDMDEERLVTLGVDPNTTGATFALGLIAVLGLAYGRQASNLKTKVLSWLPFLIMAGFLVKTGSRGAMVSLVIGIAFFTVKRGDIKSKIALCLIVVVGVGALIGLTLRSASYKRFVDTLDEGSTSGRDVIYNEAAGMINEKPITGWGPVAFRFELANRVGLAGRERDPHNLILKLLLEVGILGATPFLFGIGLCFWAAWKARAGVQGALPASILVTVFMINMSITWDGRKIFWIILAYGLVSARYVYHHRRPEVDPTSRQKVRVGVKKSSKKSGFPNIVGQTN